MKQTETKLSKYSQAMLINFVKLNKLQVLLNVLNKNFKFIGCERTHLELGDYTGQETLKIETDPISSVHDRKLMSTEGRKVELPYASLYETQHALLTDNLMEVGEDCLPNLGVTMIMGEVTSMAISLDLKIIAVGFSNSKIVIYEYYSYTQEDLDHEMETMEKEEEKKAAMADAKIENRALVFPKPE